MGGSCSKNITLVRGKLEGMFFVVKRAKIHLQAMAFDSRMIRGARIFLFVLNIVGLVGMNYTLQF
jgi:hypothetical protein